VERKIVSSKNLSEIFAPILDQTKRLLAQERKGKNKLYSLREPDVAYIGKGKAHKRYEFGCKVSVTTTHKQGLVISSEALPGNPCDGQYSQASIIIVRKNYWRRNRLRLR
jgi:IS5 family transposase